MAVWVNAVIELRIPLDDVSIGDDPHVKLTAAERVADKHLGELSNSEWVAEVSWEDVEFGD